MDEETKHIPTPTAVGGIRKRFRELMKPTHFDFPRKVGLTHKAEWYLGDKPLARPLYGMYGLARYAEYLLHHVKFGKRGQGDALREVAVFFAATRRAMQNTLSTYPIGTRLSPRAERSVRAVVSKLVELANEAAGAVRSSVAQRNADSGFQRLVEKCEQRIDRGMTRDARRICNKADVEMNTRKDI